jgi:hypothetical protein
MATYNFASALIAYARGNTPETIAHTLGIPLTTLQNKIRTEAWSKLVNGLIPGSVSAVPAERAERDLERIRANRERMAAIAERLQEDLRNQVERLVAGQLRVTKVLANGTPVEFEPGPAERQALASYAQKVGDVSYRALGDIVEPARGAGDGPPAGAANVTIVLPAHIAAPRAERTEVVDMEQVAEKTVVDLGRALPYEGSGCSDATSTESGT